MKNIKILVKYAVLPLTKLEINVLVQIYYNGQGAAPHIISIPYTAALINSNMNDLISEKIESHIRSNMEVDFVHKDIMYISCDVLVPKKNKSIFTRMWNKITRRRV